MDKKIEEGKELLKVLKQMQGRDLLRSIPDIDATNRGLLMI